MTGLTRYIVLLMLLPALAAVPAMAVCADGSGKRCCCSDKGRCHMPERGSAQTPSCCDDSDAGPPVPASRLDGGSEHQKSVSDVAAGRAPDAIQVVAYRPAIDGPAQVHPPPVTLFTLHAAFLI